MTSSATRYLIYSSTWMNVYYINQICMNILLFIVLISAHLVYRMFIYLSILYISSVYDIVQRFLYKAVFYTVLHILFLFFI